MPPNAIRSAICVALASKHEERAIRNTLNHHGSLAESHCLQVKVAGQIDKQVQICCRVQFASPHAGLPALLACLVLSPVRTE